MKRDDVQVSYHDFHYLYKKKHFDHINIIFLVQNERRNVILESISDVHFFKSKNEMKLIKTSKIVNLTKHRYL